jgi:hypothetical protein
MPKCSDFALEPVPWTLEGLEDEATFSPHRRPPALALSTAVGFELGVLREADVAPMPVGQHRGRLRLPIVARSDSVRARYVRRKPVISET